MTDYRSLEEMINAQLEAANKGQYLVIHQSTDDLTYYFMPGNKRLVDEQIDFRKKWNERFPE